MNREDPFGPPRRPGSLGRLAHYEVEAFLGRGAFGTVVRAFDEKLQRQVAIKLLSSNFGPESSAYQRFLREARAAATIRHDNVVQIYAVEETPCAYIVMECVAGETLQDRLDRDGKLDVAEAVTIAAQAARGLAAAHECGLVHRDIKPCNILVETIAGELRVKIADFGLALSKQDARLTQSGMVAGTPMYMAPEQASAHTLDGRADLFSLGSVLYALLTGVAPFGDSNPSLVLGRIVGHEPKPLRERAPHVPLAVCKVVAKMHAKNPEHRYQTGKEVADALLKALNEPNPPPKPPASRARRLALALGVVAVAAMGTYAVMGWSGGGSTSTGDPALKAPPPEPLKELPPKTPPPKIAPKPAYVWSKPKPLLGINTSSRELAPTLSDDELLIVYAGFDGLYTAKRTDRSARFENKEKLNLHLDPGVVPDMPSITGDALRLIFLARSDTGVTLRETSRATRDEPFGKPNQINGITAGDHTPYLSGDGRSLFVQHFVENAYRLWVYERKDPASAFDGGKKVPVRVPSDQHGAASWVSPDRRELAVTKSVDRINSSWMLSWDTMEKFYGRPKTLNVTHDIGRPWFSPSGGTMYFHSRDQIEGASGDLDIWYSEFVPKERP